MNKCCKVACLYLNTLRAIYIIHQNHHWLTNGPNFYGSHLLFQRLYEATAEHIDTAAEKFIGIFGEECLDYSMCNELLLKVLNKYNENSPFEKSLKVEEDFIKFSRDAYNCFEQEGEMTLGLDDMIMSIASKHEEAIYLLRQSIKG